MPSVPPAKYSTTVDPLFGFKPLNDPQVPILPKALLVLTLVYVVSPLDVIPDFIPVIGEMDDVVVVLSGLWLFIRLCPPEVVRETVHDIAARAKARG
jgi:uncharacterized membrane protein YkvA (DUF1232 family)